MFDALGGGEGEEVEGGDEVEEEGDAGVLEEGAADFLEEGELADKDIRAVCGAFSRKP